MFRPLYLSGRVRSLHVFGSFIIILVLLSTIRFSRRQPRPPSIYDYTDGKTEGTWLNDTKEPRSEEAAYLKQLAEQYGLSKDIPWFARRVQATYKSTQRSSMTDAPCKFMSHDFQRVRPDDEGLELRVESTMQLPMSLSPMPSQLDASSLIFGISTSYSRLTYSNNSLMHDWARWLTDGKGNSNGASLVLALQQAGSEEAGYASRSLQKLGIDAFVLLANDNLDVATRYTELLRHLLSHNGNDIPSAGDDESSQERLKENTGSGERKNNSGKKKGKFFAVVDDDVFFPSLGMLLSRLDGFDADRPLYLGLPSERSDWTVENNVTMTYGGGAVLFTAPMAEKVARLPCSTRNNNIEHGLAGKDEVGGRNEPEAPSWPSFHEGDAAWDELLYRCIAQHTAEDLHVLPSFYTPQEEEDAKDEDDDDDGGGGGNKNKHSSSEDDGGGPASSSSSSPPLGYGSGVQALTLHHYKHRHRFAPAKAHAVASVCGEACFLQRFRFRDNWILVNGHSLAHYPDGLAVLPLRQSARLLATQQREREEQRRKEQQEEEEDRGKKNNKKKNKNKKGPKQKLKQDGDGMAAAAATVPDTKQGHELEEEEREDGGKTKDSKNSSSDKTQAGNRLVIEDEFTPTGTGAERPREERKVVSWTGVKRTWRLLDARWVAPAEEGGNSSGGREQLWQAYVRRRGAPVSYGDEDDALPGDTVHAQEGPSDVDSVIVLIWEP